MQQEIIIKTTNLLTLWDFATMKMDWTLMGKVTLLTLVQCWVRVPSKLHFLETVTEPQEILIEKKKKKKIYIYIYIYIYKKTKQKIFGMFP